MHETNTVFPSYQYPRFGFQYLHVVFRPASARAGAHSSRPGLAWSVTADAGGPGGSHITMFIDSDPGLVIFL